MEVKLLKATEGGMELVADSARVSGIPGGISNEQIVKMIVDNDYSSALEHIVFTFELKDISIALARELLEHRMVSHTGRSTRYNEESGFGYYVPVELQRAGKEKQLEKFNETVALMDKAYKELRASGVSRESARYLLPLALHATYIWTINARSLMNFLGLRLCVRAAPEFRELAAKIYALASEKYPVIFKDIKCRAWMWGVCPENGVRASTNCPYKEKIPTKDDVKKVMWK